MKGVWKRFAVLFRESVILVWTGPSAVTAGKFDGVHMGHQKLIENEFREKSKTGKSFIRLFLHLIKFHSGSARRKTSILLQPIQNGGCFWKTGRRCGN